MRSLVSLAGLSVVAWAMLEAAYGSDAQFSTYGDMIFYLAAGLLVQSGRFGWIVPLTAAAALNRETSGLIPLMPLAWSWGEAHWPRRAALITALGLAVYGAVFVALRAIHPEQEQVYTMGLRLGTWQMLVFNLTREVTYRQMVRTVMLVPVVAVATLRRWPPPLQRLFWLIVPVWLVMHLFMAVLSETRLLLVPLVLILVPGALLGIDSAASAPQSPARGVTRT